jgi:hypothetical protein
MLKVVAAAKAAIPAGTKAYNDFKEFNERMQVFKDENRDPTPEEFRALQAETDALTDRLEAANARLNPGN